MSWDNWVFLYRTIESLVSFSSFGMTLLSILLFAKLNKPFKVLAISFWFSGLTEAIGWYIRLANLDGSYYNILGHVSMVIDCLLMGAFFYMLVKSQTRERVVIALTTFVILHNLFTVLSESMSASTEINGLTLAALLCIAGLVVFYDLSKIQTERRLLKQPEAIVVGSYVIIYSLLVLLFFLLPLITAYSGLMATQLIILKNALILLSLIGIGYGMWRKSQSRPTPTSISKPSPPPRGPN